MPLPCQAPPGKAVYELERCVKCDTQIVEDLGWEAFIRRHQPCSNFADLAKVTHTALPVLKQYRDRGVPVRLSTEPWTAERLEAALARGAHPSCDKATGFLRKEFVDMINKGQFVVLPAEVAKKV